MLRVVTLNLNGLRSAVSKGLPEWAAAQSFDFMGVQELKAQMSDLHAAQLTQLSGAPGHFHCAEKKGYSGVGLFTRHEPSEVIQGLGSPEFDLEGRWVELRFDTPTRKLSIISSYFPSGSSSEERQAAKFRFLAHLGPHLERLKAEREFILLADVNIAHKAIDLKNWKGNLKNSGFTPEERAWMDHLTQTIGLVDVYRRLHPSTTDECYTWWSQRGQAWAKNVGWRIDYQLATPALAAQARQCGVFKAQRFSDHAPLWVDYEVAM